MSWKYREPIARDRGLEAAIAEDLDALEPYMVYADFLQERGDPRGELITIQILMESATGDAHRTLRNRELDLLRVHLSYLRGPLSANTTTYHRRGFVNRLDVWSPDHLEDVVAALALDHPATRFLSEIRTEDVDDAKARLAELGRTCHVRLFAEG